MRKRLDAIRFWLVLHKPMIVLLALMVLIPALFGGKTMQDAILGY